MNEGLPEKRLLAVLLGSTVFFGAFLLFLIEPVVGKIVIPRFGGTASVWNVCLLFFQTTLLLGYALSSVLNSLPGRRQILVYLSLLALATFSAFNLTGSSWHCDPDIEPAFSLLKTLFANIAIPAIMLSTVSGIMQVWFRMAQLGDPYRLYSISNFSSMLALLCYPTVIESNFTIGSTVNYWAVSFLAMAIMACGAAFLTWRNLSPVVAVSNQVVSELAEKILPRQFVFWTLFSALGSAVLMSSTAYITADVSPMPLLWVLPLALYLLSFIFVFGNVSTYKRDLYLISWMPIAACEQFLPQGGFLLRLLLNLILIFQLCMICNGELALSKPKAEKLTTFYLAIALGGFLGGFLVGIVTPLIFEFNAERIIVLACIAVYSVYQLSIKQFLARPNKTLGYLSLALVGITLVVAAFGLGRGPNIIDRQRNFYSAVQVKKEDECLVMYHGKVNHGQQYIDPAKQDTPAGVYWEQVNIVDEFIRQKRGTNPISYGDVGLGVGVLGAYGKPGDRIHFFELDPKVVRIAKEHFTFLKRTKATLDISVGDGRAILEKLSPQAFDVLIVDAFNGDAIPCHLLTKQAAEIYLKHLKNDGLLVFHVSNSYLNLPPLLGKLAEELGLKSCVMVSKGAMYVVMSKEPSMIEELTAFAKIKSPDASKFYVDQTPSPKDMRVWTDDQSNLMSVINWK
ncbi:MAG: fused MFS/spermidine synthase [Candidatus Obscuribacterales bacterium]|nr:fused MFS/spermidine synthase [Candidatus Obscuribacterales bacterium]